jgi:polyvinyl alcohol dehydrogenase (cytochrome)
MLVALALGAGPAAAWPAWPMYGHDYANTRNGSSPPSPTLADAWALSEAWRFHGTDGDFTGTPVTDGATVVIASSHGTVDALDVNTGKLKWSRALGGAMSGSAAISGGIVYVPVATVGAPGVVALSLKDGSTVWSTTIDSNKDSDAYGSPVVWSGTVYIGTSASYGEDSDPTVNAQGSIVALDAATGALRWRTYMVPPGDDGGAVSSTPAIDTASGTLYVGTGNAYHAPVAPTTDAIVALDAGTGAIVGHFQATPSDASPNGGGPDADLIASPNLFTSPTGQQLVGEGSKNGYYYALDRRTMRRVWSQPVATYGLTGYGGVLGSTALNGPEIVGPGVSYGETWEIGTAGLPVWASFGQGTFHLGPVAVANGVVYSTDDTGHLTVRDAVTGALLADLNLGYPSYGGVSVVGPYVIAATGTQTQATGDLVAFRVPATAPPAVPSLPPLP